MTIGLRTKFTLTVAAIFVLAVGVALLLARHRFVLDARAEVAREAELLIETAAAIRGYTASRVRPHLEPLRGDHFPPEWEPAFAATETLALLQRRYPDTRYREAALNPTNPRNQAAPWEAALIERFRQDSALGDLRGERDADAGPMWYAARPIRIANPQCLACHSTPEAAPVSMIRAYGTAGGFGWKMNEVVAVQVAAVPLAAALAQADTKLTHFGAALVALLGAVALALNLMLTRMVVRPLVEVARAAEDASLARSDADLPEHGRDEIATVRAAFNRMRRSLAAAMTLAGRTP